MAEGEKGETEAKTSSQVSVSTAGFRFYKGWIMVMVIKPPLRVRKLEPHPMAPRAPRNLR